MSSFRTSEEIDIDRMTIYGQLLERMDNRGGANFTKIRHNDIEWLFNTYDTIFFQDQIAKRLENTHGKITFRVKGEKSKCEVKMEGDWKHYLFNISISIFQNMSEKENCFDQSICLLFVIEHQIVHLLMLLYDYQNKIPGDDNYSEHGSLYKCILRIFFGDVDVSHDLEGEKQKTEPRSIEGRAEEEDEGGGQERLKAPRRERGPGFGVRRAGEAGKGAGFRAGRAGRP